MAEISKDEIKRELQQMNPYEFEKLIAEIWELEGYETSVRKGSRDEGIDIEAYKQDPYHQKDLIQVKCYADGNNIGSPQIRNYATLYRQVPDADIVIVVASSDFTSEARSLAKELNVKIVDGDKIAELMYDNMEEFNPFGIGEINKDRSEEMTNETKEKIKHTISDKLEKHLISLREKGSSGKYTTGEGLDIKFLDADGDPVEMKFKYLSISPDLARFRIQITNQGHLSTIELSRLRNLGKIQDIDIQSDNAVIFTSKSGGLSAEYSVLSHLIYEFHPNYSKEDSLYLNEDIPENKIRNESVQNISENNNQQQGDKKQSGRESSKEDTSEKIYRFEKEFDEFN